MMTDPIADMLTRIRNQLRISGTQVDVPYSRMKEAVGRVLKEEGYIEDMRMVGDGPRKKVRVYLKYGPYGEQIIQSIQRVSRPGRRVYRGAGDVAKVLNGLGTSIVSTPAGVLSDRQCREQNVGGEVICTVY